MHQPSHCEETAAAEVSFSYEIAIQNPCNPEIPNFLFPGMPHGQENKSESAYLQQPSEVNNVIMNQNPKYCEAYNPKYADNDSVPVAEPCLLPRFQETFGERKVLMNPISYPNESSLTDCSGVSSHFTSEVESQQCETSLGIPILAVQNAQYNPMDKIPPTDAIGLITFNKCPKKLLPKDNLEHHDRSRCVARPYSCNYCDKAFPSPSELKRHTCIHTRERPHKYTECGRGFTQHSSLRTHIRSFHTED
ncbi:hypothetical protein CDAR_600051 [Caerostris darwini]|uniref:C2H2-type domain-containing protein n=1 Tax=Caerostris darwini TaxID=1538125 RepID=A0AAV4TER4_9ARAC|nr:hypothetical protein CDAR_600051 [Caerostris darwini]